MRPAYSQKAPITILRRPEFSGFCAVARLPARKRSRAATTCLRAARDPGKIARQSGRATDSDDGQITGFVSSIIIWASVDLQEWRGSIQEAYSPLSRKIQQPPYSRSENSPPMIEAKAWSRLEGFGQIQSS